MSDGTFAGKDKPAILLQFKVIFFRFVKHPSVMYFRKRGKEM